MPHDAPQLPPAVIAFLRGLERRAALLAQVQAGDADAARGALAVTARVFATDAGQWPLAQWPGQYWRLLLSAPAMTRSVSASPVSELPGIARLPAGNRAAVLLHLVAGLEDADAAAALGIGRSDFHQRIRDALPRDALGQPDLDVWRAWQAAAKRALEAVPLAASAPSSPSSSSPPTPPPRRVLRWLWLGVAACALALVASYSLHPRGSALPDTWHDPTRREALPAAEAPTARFDAADPAMQPDRALRAAPRELQLATRLPLLAWVSVEADTELPAVAASPAASPPPAITLPRWEQLSPRQRAARRQDWVQWQALPESERARLRDTAARFETLPTTRQQALRARFAQLPFDARHGWQLGPQLGRSWPRIAPLFAEVAASEREPLLQLLRSCSAEEIDALARLAQTTPPQDRAALRRALLVQSPQQRLAWLQARLQR